MDASLSVPITSFLDKSGIEGQEGKIMSYLFDADGDGKISFEETIQASGFMETDGMIHNL